MNYDEKPRSWDERLVSWDWLYSHFWPRSSEFDFSIEQVQGFPESKMIFYKLLYVLYRHIPSFTTLIHHQFQKAFLTVTKLSFEYFWYGQKRTRSESELLIGCIRYIEINLNAWCRLINSQSLISLKFCMAEEFDNEIL